MNGVFLMKIKEVIKRLREKEGFRRIRRETGVHRQTIRNIQKEAQEAGWLDPEKPIPSEAKIQEKYHPKKQKEHRFDPFKEEIERWLDEGYSYTVIHILLTKKFPCSETAVRNYINNHFPNLPRPVMIRATKPGEAMDVDFGQLGVVLDKDNVQRKAFVFSARLRHSRKACRKIVLKQKKEQFFKGHVDAFEYFGGVPHVVVLDNLKAGVVKSTIDNEFLNRVYQDLAEYYGFQISPCKPRKPEHKGGVESLGKKKNREKTWENPYTGTKRL